MFESPNVNQRQVAIPEGQYASRGDGVKTVTHFTPASMFAVQYLDDEGLSHDTVVMHIGGLWYLPPNGEVWARSLRPLKEDTWLAKQLSLARASSAAPLPKVDAVDVLPIEKP